MTNPTKVVFTLPTTNTDGTALAVSDVTGIRYDITGPSAVSATVASVAVAVDANGSGSFALPDLVPGSYSVVLFTEAVSQGQAVESAGSAPVSFEIVAVPSIPNPPTGVSVA